MPRFDAEKYIDVQDRINRFWHEYPDGAIRTKLMSPPDDFTQCRYEASVFKQRDNPAPDATGYAFELAGGNGANATSHEENCETSAIGRALANMGYATSRDDRPSRQEMGKVNRGQERPPQATPAPRPPTSIQRQPAPAPGPAPSTAQMNYARSLWKQLGNTVVGPDGGDHHDAKGLDYHCQMMFKRDFAAIDKQQMRNLIDNLLGQISAGKKGA